MTDREEMELTNRFEKVVKQFIACGLCDETSCRHHLSVAYGPRELDLMFAVFKVAVREGYHWRDVDEDQPQLEGPYLVQTESGEVFIDTCVPDYHGGITWLNVVGVKLWREIDYRDSTGDAEEM